MIKSVHVLVYQLKTGGVLLLHWDTTLLIGLQLESREAGDKQYNFIEKLHQSFSGNDANVWTCVSITYY